MSTPASIRRDARNAMIAAALRQMVEANYKVSFSGAMKHLGVTAHVISAAVESSPDLIVKVVREWDSQAKVSARCSYLFGGAGAMQRHRAYIMAGQDMLDIACEATAEEMA